MRAMWSANDSAFLSFAGPTCLLPRLLPRGWQYGNQRRESLTANARTGSRRETLRLQLRNRNSIYPGDKAHWLQ